MSLLTSASRVDKVRDQFKKKARESSASKKKAPVVEEEEEEKAKREYNPSRYQKAKVKVFAALQSKNKTHQPILRRAKVEKIVRNALAAAAEEEGLDENPRVEKDALEVFQIMGDYYLNSLLFLSLKESNYRPSSTGANVKANDVIKAQESLMAQKGTFPSDIDTFIDNLKHFEKKDEEGEQQ